MALSWDVEQLPERQQIERDWLASGKAFLASVGLTPTPEVTP
jgi:hypothetical protein